MTNAVFPAFWAFPGGVNNPSLGKKVTLRKDAEIAGYEKQEPFFWEV